MSADLRKQSDAGAAPDWPGDKAGRPAAGQKWREASESRRPALNYSKIGLRRLGPESRESFAQSVSSCRSRSGASARPFKSPELNRAALLLSRHTMDSMPAGRGHCAPRAGYLGPLIGCADRALAANKRLTRNPPLPTQQLATKIVLRYSQRWISFYDRQKLMFADDSARPRHLSTGKCLCQFIEEQFECADFNESDAAPTNVIETRDSALVPAPLANGCAQSALDECEAERASARSPAGGATLQRQGLGAPAELSLQQQLDLLVPTLSQLVSVRERQASRSCELATCAANKSLQHNLAAHLQHERLESNSSPATERSLDLTEASDSGRNEELIRRLKLLLDSRKDEFARGLDGQTGQGGQSARLPTIISADSLGEQLKQRSLVASTQTIDLQDEGPAGANHNHNHSHISQLGKRFFSQTEGIFFLGTKKSQQGVYGKQQQMLEIC